MELADLEDAVERCMAGVDLQKTTLRDIRYNVVRHMQLPRNSLPDMKEYLKAGVLEYEAQKVGNSAAEAGDAS